MHATPSEPVRNLVTRPPVLVRGDDPIRRVARLFVEESFGAAVVRGLGRPAIVSERDIVRAVADGLDLDTTCVEEIMTDDLAVAGPQDRVADVARTMLDDEIRPVPVVADDGIVGLVSGRDCLRAYVDATPG